MTSHQKHFKEFGGGVKSPLPDIEQKFQTKLQHEMEEKRTQTMKR